MEFIYKTVKAKIVGTDKNKGVLNYIKKCLPVLETIEVELKTTETNKSRLDLYFDEFLIGKIKEEELRPYENFKLRYGLYIKTSITSLDEETEELGVGIEWQ